MDSVEVPGLWAVRRLAQLGVGEEDRLIDRGLDVALDHDISFAEAISVIAAECGFDENLKLKPLSCLSSAEIGNLFRLTGRVTALAALLSVHPRTIRRYLDRASVVHPRPVEEQHRLRDQRPHRDGHPAGAGTEER
jgi:hypothetical protein